MGVWRTGAARISVSLVLVGVLLWNTDRAKLVTTIGALDPALFASAAVCYLLAQTLSAVRWQVLLRSEGIAVSLGRLVLFYLEGTFFNLLLPTLIGGDVVRAHRIYVRAQRNEAAVASVLVDRLSGLIALLAVAWGSLAADRHAVGAWPVLSFSAALVLGAVVISRRGVKALVRRVLGRPTLARVEEGVTSFYQAIARYGSRRGILAQVCGLSLVIQVIVILGHFLVGRALGLSTPFVVFLGLIPLATIVAMIPISVGGLGVRDGAMVYLFGRAGLPFADALGLSLGWFFVMVVCSLPGGLVFVLRDVRKEPQDSRVLQR
ncbi:MAG: lysylphosphatidylglycerol synthase transmembrane domain-containing protein [Armatimonadota bacterium]|nr:lysylphosphatidylglycerol synthase transmembrane domain-containing protein [Armatimonadota bacterium]MDR7549350.1 lysylphosphatidylglycerol synthase transmembrane domain-containing protein [Armatimonadota bacterium]